MKGISEISESKYLKEDDMAMMNSQGNNTKQYIPESVAKRAKENIMGMNLVDDNLLGSSSGISEDEYARWMCERIASSDNLDGFTKEELALAADYARQTMTNMNLTSDYLNQSSSASDMAEEMRRSFP